VSCQSADVAEMLLHGKKVVNKPFYLWTCLQKGVNFLSSQGGILPDQVTCVGYTCPICKRRVIVLRSSAPPKKSPTYHFESECECGFALLIGLEQIQALETWRERSSPR